ncbi:MAG TPA: BTAD domain-containing putative transcriptional regulator [Microlunatus sp.]
MAPEPRSPEVWIGILGPVALRVAGSEVIVPGPRRRMLLAVLAQAQGRVVGVDRLIDTLWPDGPPVDAAQALYSHVSRLRGQLGPAAGRLTRRGAGYALQLDGNEVDASVARGVVDELSDLPPDRVLARALETLDLWRGPALEEFRGLPDLYVEAVALDELRLRLQEELVRAMIEVGDASAVSEASSTLATDPLREGSVLLLMQALAREGRSAEAMTVGTAYRRRLVAETGLDPGPALARLEQDIASGRTEEGRRPRAWPARRAVSRPSGPMVGRQQDFDEVMRLHAKHRVVTLTGPGGVGKTRLALEVAAAIAELHQMEVVVVDLAAVDDPTRVLQAVASNVGLRLLADESTTAGDVANALADATLLLVLDNAEHVVDACRELVDAVDRHTRGVRTLVTSRMTLRARSEYVVRLQPLPTPRSAHDVSALERQPSVQAFLEHARRHDHSYDLTTSETEPLVEILQHLDGLPLAIELVAGQASVLSLAAIRDRLGGALDLLSSSDGDEDRQRTLRLTIRWSYDRLSHSQKALLRAISAFPGGVDLAAVEELVAEMGSGQDAVQMLHGLVDASLIDVDRSRTRYRLLFTVRSFLLGEVSTLRELAATEDRFLTWAVRAAEEIGAGLFGPVEAAADQRLRAELDNLRAARDLARTRGRFDSRVRITLALDQASIWRDLREVWSWCLELADDPNASDHRREVEIQGAGAEAARQAGDYDRAVELAQRGLAVAGDVGRSSQEAARCWSALAGVAHYRGDFPSATDAWERSARLAGPASAGFLASAALAAGYDGDRARAVTLLAEARGLESASPNGGNHAFITYVEGELVGVNDTPAAISAYVAAVGEASSVGANFVAGVAGVALASARARTGDPASAAAAYRDLLGYWRTTGHGPQLWTTARNAAALLVAEGFTREGALLLLRADASPEAATVDADIAQHSGRSFLALSHTVDPEALESLRAEAARFSSSEVVDAARSALGVLAAR